MIYNFIERQKTKIIERWGNDLYLKISRDIETYSEKWELSDFVFIENYSFNAVFFCKSKQYGDCVLKIGGEEQDAEFVSEYNVLREYNGNGRYVKVYESDIDIEKRKKAMLIERVIPGKRLREEPLLEKRLAVFSDLFNGFHIEPTNPEIYNTYIKWVCDMTNLYSKEGGQYKELAEHMMKAKDLCFEIIKTYDRKVLLHGDFHIDNIISDGNGKYMIIDPKGIIGDPVFDVMRYISNEDWGAISENGFDNVVKIIEYLEKSLNIPNKIIRQCWYIEMAMVNGWDDEDDGTVKIDNLKLAENFMNI